MRVLIIYYSQTGNTQRIAHSIRDGFLSLGHSVYVSALKNTNYTLLDEYDLIGIGSPVWCADPPVLRRFVEGLPPQHGKPVFSFCTHGTMPALYFPVMVENLSRHGFTVIGWKGWYGDCKIQIFPSPYFTAGHPDAEDLQSASEFAQGLCPLAEAVLAGDFSQVPAPPVPDVPPQQAVAVANLLSSDQVNPHCNLCRDESKCLFPSCHICQDNCPMNYIDLEHGIYGKHGDHCGDGHGCTYCELLCPTGAIHPDPPYEIVAPVGTPQSHELFQSVLSKAEAQGTFRPLVTPDELGLTTPYYSTSPQHPRIRPLSTKNDNPDPCKGS